MNAVATRVVSEVVLFQMSRPPKALLELVASGAVLCVVSMLLKTRMKSGLVKALLEVVVGKDEANAIVSELVQLKARVEPWLEGILVLVLVAERHV
jgi:hypothetical protein